MRRIEVFTADCPLCRDTLKIIKQVKCPECEVIERRCSGEVCCEPAKGYDIKSVPTIVVDGKIKLIGKPSLEEAKKAILG